MPMILAFLFALSPIADEGPSTVLSTVPVRQLEVGYRVGDTALRVRVTLASGEAIEFSRENPDEVRLILQFAELFSSGRTEMTATLENRTVRSLQLAIRR